MSKKAFNVLGWVILIGMGISWLTIGYSTWYLFLLPIAYISFELAAGPMKMIEKIKRISLSQAAAVLLAFVVSVAIVVGLIQLAHYLIDDVWHLTGMLRSVVVIVAILLSLYPVKFTFGSIVYKVTQKENASNS